MDLRFHKAIETLPERERSMLSSVPEYVSRNIQEIRFRSNRPTALCAPDKTYYITASRALSENYRDGICASPDTLNEIFRRLCSYSVYSRQNEIINGYITLSGGNRAGICGTAVYENGELKNLRDISSVNIRIAREFISCSDELLKELDIKDGLLICGAPCTGKTTLLRDIARALSYKYKCALVDSRGEIASAFHGCPQNDVGMCDVFDGFSRAEGIEQAVRCMSPEVIICDEISAKSDSASLGYARDCGVSVAASAHCADKSELMNKTFLKELIKKGTFKYVVFLKSRREAGKIDRLYKSDELCA